MSAMQCLNFTRYFGIIIGDKVDEDEQAWILYTLLRRIIAFVTSPRLHQGYLIQLESLIPEFLSLYKNLGGVLTIKLHNLLHLLRVIIKNGPPMYFSSLRPEAKHRSLKLIAVTTSNRVNLPKTIALRGQLQLAYMRYSQTLSTSNFLYETKDIIDDQDKRFYFRNSEHGEIIYRTNFISVEGIHYNVDSVVVIEMGEEMEDLLFGLIKDIYIKKNEVYLRMRPLKCMYFNDRYYAYCVRELPTDLIKKPNEILDIHPCLLVNKKDVIFVVPKYVL